MSETHLQVKLDGTTITRKTVLWPSSKKEQEPIVRGIFELNNWRVSEIRNQGGSFWKVTTSCNNYTLKINLYISSIRDEDRQPDEFKMQLGQYYPESEEQGWITLVIGIYTIAEDDKQPQYILSGYDRSRYDFSSNPSIRGTRTAGLQKAYTLGMFKTDKSILFRPEFIYYYIEYSEFLFGNISKQNTLAIDRNTYLTELSTKSYRPLLSALRTKPFLLLAGISGTGKSRKVQELAYLTCKRDGIHDTDKASPGNYLLIPVKPNWHDSTELLGYYSSITGKYVLTDFIRFLWKAWLHRDVPYFLCLDEMNLAPVEQYFAEYLSILETRKRIYNEDRQKYEIQTAELLSKKLFEGLDTYAEVKIEDNGGDDEVRTKTVPLYKGEDVQIINFLKENGLRLPDNLFVIGTVNMDDTTHQFSRKVIDRAFTIEMNGDELSKMFDVEDTLAYQESPLAIKAIRPRFIKAQEVLEAYPQDAETIKAEVPAMLDRINGEGIFKNTPFRVSYRVQNELILYYAAIRPDGELQPNAIKGCLREAFMAVLQEKVLPRVEGDEKAMHCNEKGDSAILQNIRNYLTESFAPEEGTESQLYTTLLDKLDEMNERVKNSYFTSFFS